jgi:ribosome-binding factor A
MVRNYRIDMVAHEIMREVGRILIEEVKDPRIQLTSVTRVKVSKDLKRALVFVSILGDGDAKEAAMAGLASAAPFVTRRLRDCIRARHVPAVAFRLDEGIEYMVHIAEVLREIGPFPAYEDGAAPSDGDGVVKEAEEEIF